jgi:hypothetical protein
MRRTTNSILMIALLSVVFSDLVIVMSWKINQVYIAKFFCVERQISTSDCGGTCYLTTQLEARRSPQADSVPLAKLLEQSRSLQLLIADGVNDATLPTYNKKLPRPSSDKLPDNVTLTDVFHPPRA